MRRLFLKLFPHVWFEAPGQMIANSMKEDPGVIPSSQDGHFRSTKAYFVRGFDLIYLFSLIDSTLKGARLAVGGTRLSDGRCLEPSGMHLYLFWPRMSQTLYGLVVPQMCAPGRSGHLFLQVCIHAWKENS